MAQVSKTMLKMFAPAPYDGKDHAQALAYLARAKTFFNHLPATFSEGEKFMLLLNLLQDEAAAWALPYYVQLDASPPPWTTFAAFEADFKAHFCAVDDQAAAYQELRQLCRGANRPKVATLKEWTAKFNALAARTALSNEDCRLRYQEALPSELQRQLAVTASDISDLAKMQAVVLKMSQALAAIEATQFQPWKGKGRGRQTQKAAAAMPKKTETRTCRICGKVGHLARNCDANKLAATQIGELEDQIKALEAKLAAATVADKQEVAQKEQEDF